MSYWILPKSGKPISWFTVKQFINPENNTYCFMIIMRDYTTYVNQNLEAEVSQDLPLN